MLNGAKAFKILSVVCKSTLNNQVNKRMNSRAPQIYVIAGPNGSGKTTSAKTFNLDMIDKSLWKIVNEGLKNETNER